MTENLDIQLKLSRHQAVNGLKYQRLTIELTGSDRIIHPQDLRKLELPGGIDTTQGVVLTGRGPIWLYGYLIHELHPTAWVACHDPRLGAVVVATHTRGVSVGQIIPLEMSDARLHPALMIVGPPDSGKSVLAHGLFHALLAVESNIFLERANWDGEGNYTLELGENGDPEAFKARNKGGLTPDFFPYHAEAILKLRREKLLTIVDVGGMVQPEKQPILEACTHYLIISSKPEAIEPWHQFCGDRGNLTPVAVIHSTLEDVEIVHQQQPFLEITCGPWVMGQQTKVPQVLLERIKELLGM
jgi:CRISPR-associated protein Csx3